VSPQAATRLQIEHYRRMTGEERLKVGSLLNDLTSGVARLRISLNYPQADWATVEKLRRAQSLACVLDRRP
jgi:hypothetical protein